MDGNWRYRLASAVGVVGLTAGAVTLANSGVVQGYLSVLPVVGRLSADPPTATEGVLEVATTVCIVVLAFLPLYKPRPRRILEIATLAGKRVIVAMFALAAIGYFDYTYRLPRLTLLTVTPILLCVLPMWFVWVRRRPVGTSERVIVVGDDRAKIEEVAADIDSPILGYVCPTSVINHAQDTREVVAATATDGGQAFQQHDRLGGLSRIEDVLVQQTVDTVVLAFEQTDRAEFFGTLDACYEHGVSAKVHRDHADQVLTADEGVATFVDVDLEPWDIQDYLLKRGFDILFAAGGLLVLSPIIVAIAIAIKLDDGGAIFYRQHRTAVFGEPFVVTKFRSMVEDAEATTGATISDEDEGGVDPRVTRVGRLLRQTHLDEIPQLWAVLRGDMSVVGPRPERPELDAEIQTGVVDWQKRWFIKPGLTGIAQVNDVTGAEPDAKLRYDLQYIKTQSFWFDMKLIIRQIWKVLTDVAAMIR